MRSVRTSKLNLRRLTTNANAVLAKYNGIERTLILKLAFLGSDVICSNVKNTDAISSGVLNNNDTRN